MKKHTIYGVLLLITFLSAPLIANAVGITSQPFGARVLTTTLPGVVCMPPGMGPVTRQPVVNVTSALYSAFPIYTTSPLKVPRPGGWILGLHETIPSFTTCSAAGFPVPVIRTTIYGVSGLR